jgi:hypothetical protein
MVDVGEKLNEPKQHPAIGYRKSCFSKAVSWLDKLRKMEDTVIFLGVTSMVHFKATSRVYSSNVQNLTALTDVFYETSCRHFEEQ